MFFSGIADEASPALEDQVRAHKELGWSHIEVRNVSRKNLTDLSDADFAAAAAIVEAAGLQVSCFASQLANWSRPIDGDEALDAAELRRAIPRMQQLRCPFIRCMSYPNAKSPLPDVEWRQRTVARMRRLAHMAEDGGVTLVHENCSGWGGQGPQQSLDLLDAVGSPRLKLVFDTGNPIQYGQDAWEYYSAVREHVVYVHVKDYLHGKDPHAGGEERACFPGEGKAYVREILADLVRRGYRGGLSIEPHITSVIHLGREAGDPALAYRTYVEYGRRLMRLVDEVRSRGASARR
jgi:sugar phosphate isomerase/epimerase